MIETKINFLFLIKKTFDKIDANLFDVCCKINYIKISSEAKL